MSKTILPPSTAGIFPKEFSDDLFFIKNRTATIVILAIVLIAGFVLRVDRLGAESLGEDELNKLQTVQEYRKNGLTGKNGEHPFLMKGLQTLSTAASEKINSIAASPQPMISPEAALRFPVALIGTFTVLVIFLLVAELFGGSIGLISAALWAIEPMAIGFDRIAKEDSMVLFFFLLTGLFWVKSQTAAQRDDPKWLWYAWGAAMGFAGLMASKYYPHLLAVTGAYYNIFIRVPGNKWNMGKIKWLIFFAIMGVTFLILNPTIMLPDTWREMLKFSSEGRIAHDSYEFMGVLYPQKVTLWLAGVPWTFYYVFIAVKTTLATLILALIGLPIMFKRRMGDGRFFIFFWAFMWFMPFTVLGGKFTRYFTLVEPLILIAAATGFCFAVMWISKKLPAGTALIPAFQVLALIALIAFPLANSLSVTPHFRLFTNAVGGGQAAAGNYFPHDEFYDAGSLDIVSQISGIAAGQAIVACETPALFEYYAFGVGRGDIKFVSLSDPREVAALRPGDMVVVTRGRRYISNAAYEDYLKLSAVPAAEISLAGVPSALIYQLDEKTSAGIRAIAK